MSYENGSQIEGIYIPWFEVPHDEELEGIENESKGILEIHVRKGFFLLREDLGVFLKHAYAERRKGHNLENQC